MRATEADDRSLYIIIEWIATLADTTSKLTGKVANARDVSRCLYLVSRFALVQSISGFELYHAGDNMVAEVDVVLPMSFQLKEAHDLGEIITYCIESITGIERAYIVRTRTDAYSRAASRLQPRWPVRPHRPARLSSASRHSSSLPPASATVAYAQLSLRALHDSATHDPAHSPESSFMRAVAGRGEPRLKSRRGPIARSPDCPMTPGAHGASFAKR